MGHPAIALVIAMNLRNPSARQAAAAKTRREARHPGSQVQIYCQREMWSALARGLDPNWRVLPLTENYPGDAVGAAVVLIGGLKNLSESWTAAIRDHRANLLYAIGSDGAVPQSGSLPIFAVVHIDAPPAVLRSQIHAAYDNLMLLRRQREMEKLVQRSRSEIDRLNEIGVALSSQHDRESLLNLILQKSREISQSDAGSLYLVEDDGHGVRRLRFTLTQNDSVVDIHGR